MSHRSRPPRTRQHIHCDSCLSRRCRAPVEVSVSCAVTPCRLLCGAVFHLCKEEEHLLLCPNVRVPCLNADYGCPLHLSRSSRAAHLQFCPASVVCCSMEWNRWPANDCHSHPNPELYENLLRDKEQGECLDFAMTLKDQDRLFHSLKMAKIFPELIQSVGEDEEDTKEDKTKGKRKKERQEQKKAEAEGDAADGEDDSEASGQTWESFCKFKFQKPDEEEDDIEEEVELTQEEREALARSTGVDAEFLQSYSAWESMFSMEMGGCRTASEAAAGGVKGGKGKRKGRGKQLDTLKEEDAPSAKEASGGTCASVAPCASGAGLRKTKTKFVYERLEPMKIITVRTFKVPTSFAAKQSRIRNPGFYRRESKAVDTSDLGVVPIEMPVWEEVQASLLCSLEKEQRGHLIAEGICTDGLLQDEGTQTYNFLSAPFRRNMSLADLTAVKPLELHLQLQVESVTSRHHKASSAFTFVCGHTFQRRDYGKHYKNVHTDIQMSVNGWFEQRCPLAYLGCTYSQRRFRPSTHEATVTYSEELGCFNLRPTIPLSPGDGRAGDKGEAGGRAAGHGRSLGSLPFEVLCHVASFLDSVSLSQLSLVSQLMRQVCWSLLQDRGMVTLHWEKQGRAKWRATQKVWQFSTVFSSVDSWHFRDVPSVSEHLKVCPCYQRELRVERVLLPRVREALTHSCCKAPTLVSMFQKNDVIM